MELQEKDIKSIRSIAWSFYHTTELDWNDLFQEAAIAYIESINNKNVEFKKTYAFQATKNHLKNYINWEFSRNMISLEYENIDKISEPKLFIELYSELTQKAKKIANIVLDSPEQFLLENPKKARGIIYKKLREKGWSWRNIWRAFKEIKTTLNETVS